ncbi:Aste57867_11698 [Aphanomyces stellatus]|uniref:Aste57867_11698 protein n=1 Tax=Aphanomyces stellatus TaxID=120398 RepID=A0A485KUV4_9STRA|nr:hypothetical protein As57867_011655 [Aphanomyces stellatus]VFT88555.1 Aste57867_11698 [Aphanomyces stellatus]
MVAIGIDFGTSSSCVAAFRHGRADVLPNEQGVRSTLSIVAFAGHQRLFGTAAKAQAVMNHKQTFVHFKSLLGRKLIDVDKRSYSYTLGENEHGMVHVVLDHDDDDDATVLLPEQITAMVLSHLVRDATVSLGEVVTATAISIPTTFSLAHRRSMYEAARLAGLDAVRLVTEPVAAALAYVASGRSQQPSETLLVVNWGSGHFDASVLGLNTATSVVEVHATVGDNTLGGHDLDIALTMFCVRLFDEDDEKSILADPKHGLRLLHACKAAKQTLTMLNETFVGAHEATVVLTRDELESVLQPKLDAAFDHIKTVLAMANATTTTIDQVLLVGGCTRMPKFQEMVRTLLIPICKFIHTDEAVACGASFLAAKECRWTVRERLTGALGLRTNRGIVATLAPINASYPTTIVHDCVVASGASLTVCDMRDQDLVSSSLRNLPRRARHEVTAIVRVVIDENGMITNVTAKDSKTSEAIEIHAPTFGLSKRKRKLLQQFAAADLVEKERVQAQLRLDDYLFAKHNVPEIAAIVDHARTWLDANKASPKATYDKMLKKVRRQVDDTLAK